MVQLPSSLPLNVLGPNVEDSIASIVWFLNHSKSLPVVESRGTDHFNSFAGVFRDNLQGGWRVSFNIYSSRSARTEEITPEFR